MKVSHLVIGSVIGAVAIQAVGAKLVGNSVEAGVRRTVQMYSEQARFPIEVSNFEGGWFSSAFDVRMPIPAAFVEPLAKIGIVINAGESGAYFDYATSIKHGPVIFDNGIHFSAAHASGTGSIELDEMIDKAIAKEEDADVQEVLKTLKPQLARLMDTLQSTYTIDVAFNGDVLFSAAMNGGTSSIKNFPEKEKMESLTFDIGSATSSWKLEGAADKAHTNAQWDGLDVSLAFKDGGHTKVTMGAINMHAETSRLGEGLWGGSANASIKSIGGYGTVEGKPFDMRVDKITMASDTQASEAAGNMIGASVKMAMHDIKIEANGGKLFFDNFITEFDIQNMLLPLLEAEAEMARNTWLSAAKDEPDSEPFAFLQSPEFSDTIDHQLQASPRINLTDYKVIANGEDVGLSGFMQLIPGASFASLQEGSTIWPFLDGEMAFRLSPSMIKAISFNTMQMSERAMPQEQIDQMVDLQIDQYQQMGLITPEGDNFISNIKIANDILSVNGKPMAQISQAMAAAQPTPEAVE